MGVLRHVLQGLYRPLDTDKYVLIGKKLFFRELVPSLMANISRVSDKLIVGVSFLRLNRCDDLLENGSN